MYFKYETDGMTLQGCAVTLGSSFLMLTAFVRPARERLSKAVEEIDIPKIWYSTVVISSIFLVFNVLAMPDSYDTVRESRLRFLYPIFEASALTLLITVCVLFYGIVIGIEERMQLERRSRQLEMQAGRFRELQEYMKQTERLRHDFKHSVHILVHLAGKGDLDGVRSHLDEYEQRLNEHACAALPEGQRYFSLISEIQHGNSLYIVSTNSFDGKVLKSADGNYRSTKHGGHGTGLSSIAAAAEKYGGSARFGSSDKEFYTDVVLKV